MFGTLFSNRVARLPRPAKARWVLQSCLIAGLIGLSGAARAVDGCQVLLCFAAPNWRVIPQCVPPIQQVLHDLARGKPLPVCAMTGNGASAENSAASAPDFCPVQYTRLIEVERMPVPVCRYSGAVSVTISGALFTRTWWSAAGDAVTEFSPQAKTQLGTWDTRFDDEYAAWLTKRPKSSSDDER